MRPIGEQPGMVTAASCLGMRNFFVLRSICTCTLDFVVVHWSSCESMSNNYHFKAGLPFIANVEYMSESTSLDMSKTAGPNKLSAETKVQGTTFGKDGGPKTSILKVNGHLKSFASVGKDALVALGVAGDLIGAASIIIDFADHNWIGGAIGLTGLAAGVAAAAAISGHLGWVVGGAIATFFASMAPSSLLTALDLCRN